MVRVLPKTLLVQDMAADADDAQSRARNEPLPDGSECWYRFFTRDDRAKADDPRFAMGMVRHEFARLVVGMFSRATGRGELNACEYGHVDRVQVTSALAIAGLGLDRALRVQGEPLRNS